MFVCKQNTKNNPPYLIMPVYTLIITLTQSSCIIVKKVATKFTGLKSWLNLV